MQNPDERVVPDLPTEPLWKNGPRRCTYVSAIGIELGYVQLGEGAASKLWFSYLRNSEKCLVESGLSNREAAKAEVEKALRAEWDQKVAQSNSRKKGRQR